jgi:hypothetical protein
MSDATLTSAFDAFWGDAKEFSRDLAGLRQAFKNGAAIIVAREAVCGPGAVVALINGGKVRTLQQIWPWIVKNLEVHREWGEVHRDAVIYGGFAALALFRARVALQQELDAFQP